MGRKHGAEAEARNGGGVRVWTYQEGTESLGRRGGLVPESEDEEAGLNFFGRQ